MQRKRGIPKLLTDEFVVKMEDVVIGVRMAGGVISRKMIFAIVTRVIKAIFHQNWGTLEVTLY